MWGAWQGIAVWGGGTAGYRSVRQRRVAFGDIPWPGARLTMIKSPTYIPKVHDTSTAGRSFPIG